MNSQTFAFSFGQSLHSDLAILLLLCGFWRKYPQANDIENSKYWLIKHVAVFCLDMKELVGRLLGVDGA